jgi:hypothetical protein
MAVLVEGISVIVRRDAVQSLYPGGWEGFVADAPNKTLCADPNLARVGFMAPDDVKAFVAQLERVGLSERGSQIFLERLPDVREPGLLSLRVRGAQGAHPDAPGIDRELALLLGGENGVALDRVGAAVGENGNDALGGGIDLGFRLDWDGHERPLSKLRTKPGILITSAYGTDAGNTSYFAIILLPCACSSPGLAKMSSSSLVWASAPEAH